LIYSGHHCFLYWSTAIFFEIPIPKPHFEKQEQDINACEIDYLKNLILPKMSLNKKERNDIVIVILN